jgi:two-component system nitrogen regulation response regulator GlnG
MIAGRAAAVFATPDVVMVLGADASRVTLVADSLRGSGFKVARSTHVEDCHRQIVACGAALCLVDLGADGARVAAIRTLRSRHPMLTLVALCEAHRADLAEGAQQAGAAEVATWPAAPGDLAAALINARERAAAPHERTGDPADAEPLMAQSAAMQNVIELVTEAARGRAGVCVSGEPGSGRTLLGRTIHRLSDDGGARPFVVEDCGEDTPYALESRLFGIVSPVTRIPAAQSSGTEQIGASGAIYRANGGALLLRNIGDAPARVQTRLARLLRDREAVLVNGKRIVVELDVQPIATLDSGPDAALADGRLRRDLYKQLAQICIDMPALRRRREDIAPLARHFLRRLCEARQIPFKHVSRAAIQVMTALPWPGNAAELQSLLGELASSVDDPVIHLEHLLARISLDGFGQPAESGGTLRDARARFERDCISAVLIRHRGRVPEAAKALGIQRTNLYRKIRQLNVARSLLSARR